MALPIVSCFSKKFGEIPIFIPPSIFLDPIFLNWLYSKKSESFDRMPDNNKPIHQIDK